MITLHNHFLTASIHPKGAELQSLRQSNGMEYMWNGDERFWAKQSPILFPIVGSLVNGSYHHKGQTYALPRHGFARDRVFEAHQVSDTEAIFTLRSDEQSRSVYPFDFELRLVYQLGGHRLACRYEVLNNSEDNMYFSIGGHPAFAVPIDNIGEYTDYYLELEEPEALQQNRLQDGLLTRQTKVVELEDNLRLWLKPELFYEDAMVLRQMKNTTIGLHCRLHLHGLRFHFGGFPYFGIWAAKDAPFVCLEPWCGHADWTDHNGELAEKEGIIRLAPGQEWQQEWGVEVF
jgi:galactose mutarotase-like enzyme